MDPAIIGSCRIGYFRIGVFRDDWDRLVDQFKKGALSFDVSRRKLVLGEPDSLTGWYKKSYTESTIEMILFDRATTSIPLPLGAYIRLDALGITADPVEIGDEIKTGDGRVYEVEAIREVWAADSFVRRDCDLTLLPLHE